MNLSRREILAWRDHAPWANDAQVEQDLLLTRAMVAIFADPVLAPMVAMRGGTALHKVHLAPAARYSEDIDLVLVDGDVANSKVERELRRVLRPLLGAPDAGLRKRATLFARNALSKSTIIRLEYPFVPLLGNGSGATIKVEVNCNERRPLYRIEELPYDPEPMEGRDAPLVLRTYDVDEMLGTKLRALHQRTQGRDLFDMWWAFSGHATGPHTPDPARVIAAFDDYMAREGSPVDAETYRRTLESKLADPAFAADMDGMLRQGVPPFVPREAADLVLRILVPLMRGGGLRAGRDEIEPDANPGPS